MRSNRYYSRIRSWSVAKAASRLRCRSMRWCCSSSVCSGYYRVGSSRRFRRRPARDRPHRSAQSCRPCRLAHSRPGPDVDASTTGRGIDHFDDDAAAAPADGDCDDDGSYFAFDDDDYDDADADDSYDCVDRSGGDADDDSS